MTMALRRNVSDLFLAANNDGSCKRNTAGRIPRNSNYNAKTLHSDPKWDSERPKFIPKAGITELTSTNKQKMLDKLSNAIERGQYDMITVKNPNEIPIWFFPFLEKDTTEFIFELDPVQAFMYVCSYYCHVKLFYDLITFCQLLDNHNFEESVCDTILENEKYKNWLKIYKQGNHTCIKGWMDIITNYYTIFQIENQEMDGFACWLCENRPIVVNSTDNDTERSEEDRTETCPQQETKVKERNTDVEKPGPKDHTSNNKRIATKAPLPKKNKEISKKTKNSCALRKNKITKPTSTSNLQPITRFFETNAKRKEPSDVESLPLHKPQTSKSIGIDVSNSNRSRRSEKLTTTTDPTFLQC